MKRRHTGIPQQAVSVFINMRNICQTQRSFPKVASGKPIISIGFLTRLQIGLIEMRSWQYNGYNFILHANDHFTNLAGYIHYYPQKLLMLLFT